MNGNKSKVRFYLERDRMLPETAVILLLLSPLFRFIGCWGLWNDRFFVAVQMALPVAACLIMALCIFFFGKRAFWLSCIPVLMGAGYFMVYACGLENWMRIAGCIAVTILVTAVYICTMFGVIRTKWLLPPLFALILVYRIGWKDIEAMQDAVHPVSFSAGMLEISLLCAVAAFLCVSLALKKREIAPAQELPKIKDPVVLPPEPSVQAAAAETEAVQQPAAEAEDISALPARDGEGETAAAPAEAAESEAQPENTGDME